MSSLEEQAPHVAYPRAADSPFELLPSDIVERILGLDEQYGY